MSNKKDNLALLQLRNVNDPAYRSVRRVKSNTCTAWKYVAALLVALLIFLICLLYRHIQEHKKNEKSILLIINAIDRIDRICENIENKLIPLLKSGFQDIESKAGREPDKGFDAPGFEDFPGSDVLSRDRVREKVSGDLFE